MSRILRIWTIVCATVAAALVLSQLAEIPYRSALRGYDNTFNYLWLRSAMVDRDWDFRNDLEQCNTLTPEYREHALALPKTAIGRIPNKYGVGWAMVTLPFYVAADVTVRAGRAAGLWSLAPDGFNPVYQVWIQLGHVALAGAALWLSVRTLGRWFGDRRVAAAAVVTVWAASPLLYYQTCDVSMSHGVAFFAIAALAYALTRATQMGERERGRAGQDGGAWVGGWWILAGAAFGLAVTTRFQLAVFGLVLVWAVVRCGRDARAPTQPSAAAEGERDDPHTPAFGHPSREGTSSPDPVEIRSAEHTPARSRHLVVPHPAQGAAGLRYPSAPLQGQAASDHLRLSAPSREGIPATDLNETRNSEPETRNGRPVRATALIALGAAPFVVVQLLAWHAVYGRWLVFSYGAEGETFHWLAPHVASLISPWHGLYYWHPFLLLGTIGLIAWARSSARVALPWLLAVGLTMYVNAAWWCWWYGSAFGNRAFDAALFPVMAGAAWWLLRAGPSWRRLYWIAAIAAGTWNFYAVMLYRTGAVSRSAPVTWGEFWQAIVRLPAALHF